MQKTWSEKISRFALRTLADTARPPNLQGTNLRFHGLAKNQVALSALVHREVDRRRRSPMIHSDEITRDIQRISTTSEQLVNTYWRLSEISSTTRYPKTPLLLESYLRLLISQGSSVASGSTQEFKRVLGVVVDIYQRILDANTDDMMDVDRKTCKVDSYLYEYSRLTMKHHEASTSSIQLLCGEQMYLDLMEFYRSQYRRSLPVDALILRSQELLEVRFQRIDDIVSGWNSAKLQRLTRRLLGLVLADHREQAKFDIAHRIVALAHRNALFGHWDAVVQKVALLNEEALPIPSHLYAALPCLPENVQKKLAEVVTRDIKALEAIGQPISSEALASYFESGKVSTYVLEENLVRARVLFADNPLVKDAASSLLRTYIQSEDLDSCRRLLKRIGGGDPLAAAFWSPLLSPPSAQNESPPPLIDSPLPLPLELQTALYRLILKRQPRYLYQTSDIAPALLNDQIELHLQHHKIRSLVKLAAKYRATPISQKNWSVILQRGNLRGLSRRFAKVFLQQNYPLAISELVGSPHLLQDAFDIHCSTGRFGKAERILRLLVFHHGENALHSFLLRIRHSGQQGDFDRMENIMSKYWEKSRTKLMDRNDAKIYNEALHATIWNGSMVKSLLLLQRMLKLDLQPEESNLLGMADLFANAKQPAADGIQTIESMCHKVGIESPAFHRHMLLAWGKSKKYPQHVFRHFGWLLKNNNAKIDGSVLACVFRNALGKEMMSKFLLAYRMQLDIFLSVDQANDVFGRLVAAGNLEEAHILWREMMMLHRSNEYIRQKMVPIRMMGSNPFATGSWLLNSKSWSIAKALYKKSQLAARPVGTLAHGMYGGDFPLGAEQYSSGDPCEDGSRSQRQDCRLSSSA